ncbi:MAG: hypothetical protein AMXMBFR8_14860 [Nevskiales bacterium]
MLLALGSSAQAALLGRDLNGSPGSFEAYYDTVLDITWLANANLADTNAFGVSGINADGTMNWAKANEWIAAMNSAAYLGISDWRLPTVTDTGTSGCNFAYTGTDCGYNVDLSTGEMAHMFYSTLGNLAYYNTSGSGSQPGWGLTNTGPFSNLKPRYYWSGTTYAPGPSYAWNFGFLNGYQNVNDKSLSYYAWAVRPGDALVPVPAAVWLFGSALGVMGVLRRRSLTGTEA